MQIFNKIAGFSLGEADIIRRAMSKKKIEILTDPETNYHGKFIEGLKNAGAPEEDAEDFWNELLNFAEYAFNKSHAAAYAHIAYYTAWLKYHYPAEYMCSVMARTGFEKLSMLINDCLEMGLTIQPPTINSSKEDFISFGDTIIFGFNNIKGVGNAGSIIVGERKANGQFTSFKDAIYRLIPEKGSDSQRGVTKANYETLIDAGTFDVFCSGNRQSIKTDLSEFIDHTKKLKAKRRELEEKTEEFNRKFVDACVAENDKERKKAHRSLTTCQKATANLYAAFVDKAFLTVNEDIDEKLSKEYELLGCYISGNPIDKYKATISKIPNITKLSDLGDSGNVTVCGIVKDARMLTRKSDGRPFSIFRVFDETGEIEVKCFTKAFSQYGDLIDEGKALCIEGWIYIDERDEGEGEKAVTANLIKPVIVKSNERIMIRGGDTIADWNAIHEQIKPFIDTNGCNCFYVDSITKELRLLTERVSTGILNHKFDGILISKM